jgi:dTDP-glucose 4,6-dehydratase/UDP-glucose 4-epimerase
MKLLILGSRGFIGRYLCEHFTLAKYDIVGCDIFTFNEATYPYYQLSVLSADLEDIFSANQFDICINASGAANVSHSVLFPLSDFEANVFFVAKVLDIIRKQQSGCRYLHFSSAAVYGNPAELPVNESAPLNPISPYGYHKWMSELLCKEFYSLFGLKIAIVRPFSVYGEGLRKQILWDLCNKCYNQKEIFLFGHGTETRDFIHISDLCRSIELLLKNSNFEYDIYNLANGNGIEIKEIADRISVRFPESNISFNQQVKEGDPLYWTSDISKIKSLGYLNQISLENGINSYIDWFLNCSLL